MLEKDTVLQHYRTQASIWKDDARSTMEDETIRKFEVERIIHTIGLITKSKRFQGDNLAICDVGCGNGHTLSEVTRLVKGSYTGLDISKEMLEVAKTRNMPDVQLIQSDISIEDELPDLRFDIVYSERCLINILDEHAQLAAIQNIWKLLRPGGYYIMIEAFTDGLEMTNKARRELGLDPINSPHHNLFIDKTRFLNSLDGLFRRIRDQDFDESDSDADISENFLSSYYFVSRVIYPSVTNADVIRNTEFVKFFSFLPPIGNYAPLQCFVLKKLEKNQ